MKKLVLTLIVATAALTAVAQPAKRRTTASSQTAGSTAATKTPTASDRASLLFPVKDAMPEDVAWRRDIYRQLDLDQPSNAPLYYPVVPNGQEMNLFTCLFRLVLSGRITAYSTYNLSGNESFADKDKLNLKDFLSDQSIYYEEKNGKLSVADADVPSAEVKRYYLKESTYMDQRTGTLHTKVVALCPIRLLDSANEFAISSDFDGEDGEDASSANYTAKELFWVKYDDVAPYLAKLSVMASDLNNVTNMTAADYFNMNRYRGKIYKTNNTQGRLLKDYCKTDSAMSQEQERIEKELRDFEENLWGHAQKEVKPASATATSTTPASADSVQTDAATTDAAPAKTAKEPRSRRTASAKEKTAQPATTATARVSARRERR